MDKVDLIRQCQAGNLGTFEELYRVYKKNAMGTAYLISGNKEIAEDIVQEAFFQCYKKIGSLKDPAAFDVWFYKLLMRTAWNISSKYRETIPISELDDEVFYDGKNLSMEVDFGETRMLIQQAVEMLSPPLKTVVILYYFDDLSIKQISVILGCLQGTVKSRLHNAKKFLKKMLDDWEFEGFSEIDQFKKGCKASE